MRKSGLPQTDSIQELAAFWDTHDLTDFEEELTDVPEPVFVRESGITVPLNRQEVRAVERIARTRGVSREELIRAWVRQRITQSNNAANRRKRRT